MLLNRRVFLKTSLAAGSYLLGSTLPILNAQTINPKEALHYIPLANSSVQCQRCPHSCVITKGERGFCRVRENNDGKLYNIVYGKPCAVHVDPIEKKPLFHVLPGTMSFSIATVGCNLTCKFCQNWQISQASPENVQTVEMPPELIVSKALKTKCKTIAYTYTEASVFYEYMLDIAKIAQDNDIKNVIHSNGFINPKPLKELCPYITAMNVDLKGFSENYYNEICSGNLKTVLNSLCTIKEQGVWLELTNLLIPTLNDSTKKIKEMCSWIKNNLGNDVPIHFSRFFPTYKLTTLPPTPVSTLENARNIALDVGLKFVYIGNLPGHAAENTYCPHCNNVIIKRSGYTVLENTINNGNCTICGNSIQGVWT
ncbi:MAG: AmmeMemoRadiSam system radical SAM enzyme [PVC group bacterium]|nr:AmmeMemoRadiSam system radical SAM enzyme [PVC group bacterium]